MFPRMYYIIALLAAIVVYMYMTKKWIFKAKKPVEQVTQEPVIQQKEVLESDEKTE